MQGVHVGPSAAIERVGDGKAELTRSAICTLMTRWALSGNGHLDLPKG